MILANVPSYINKKSAGFKEEKDWSISMINFEHCRESVCYQAKYAVCEQCGAIHFQVIENDQSVIDEIAKCN